MSLIEQYKIDQKPLWVGAVSAYKYDEVLEERMKFKSKFGDDVNMSFVKDGMLMVPRRLTPPGVGDYRTTRDLGAIKCKVGPRSDEQAECIAKSVALLKSGVDHVMQAPTGWGKTYGGSAIAAELGQATLIIVPKSDLMFEWKNTLINLIGIPASEIGHIQGDVCNYQGKRFTLAMVHSLVIDGKYDDAMLKYFGLIVFDETHKMAADTFQIAARMFSAKYRLGLSATPKRSDGKDPVIEAHIGEVRVIGKQIPMKPKIIVERTAWSIPKFKRWNHDKQQYEMQTMPYSPGRMAGVFKRMAADPARNAIIANMAKQAYDAGRHHIIMSDTLEHLKLLHLIIANKGVPGENFGFYVGGTKKKTKEQLDYEASKPIVLATYAMTKEGTNYPSWDMLTLATPKADVEQAIGRVMRMKPDKKTPIVFDLVDVDSIFRGFYSAREVQYYRVQAEIVKG
ncbi:superfamily II DNA or RNA helicase [Stenotrophomonas phage vB_SmaS_DLP_3]|nr:superfamily II DNA or RNA helicase [Stenotrophomonas phage vB_SmaS_DLP_3]